MKKKKLKPDKIQRYCELLNERGHNVTLEQAQTYLENILSMRKKWKNISVVDIWESVERNELNLKEEELNELVEFIFLVKEL